jgi:arylsulfatase A-like enzyme
MFLVAAACIGCEAGAGSAVRELTADTPLHLEDHLDAATIVGSEIPSDQAASLEWRFAEPQPGWKSERTRNLPMFAVKPEQTEDALRLELTPANRAPFDNSLHGYVYVDVPDLRREDWDHVLVRARATGPMREVGFWLNLGERQLPGPQGGSLAIPFMHVGNYTPVISDGDVHSYQIPADAPFPFIPIPDDYQDPWKQLIIEFSAGGPATLELLSVSLVPKGAAFGSARAGRESVALGGHYRRALFAHTPAGLEYRVRIPTAARLDFGLGVRRSQPVTFRVTAVDSRGDSVSLFEEAYAKPREWGQRSVDLSSLAGQTVTLALRAESSRPGDIALWGAPTVSQGTATVATATRRPPNVIFYVVDGGGADFMSVYGYNRRTTPELERLAAEGTVFERAHSNSTWTTPSTASFMTSLHHSVLGPYRSAPNLLPDSVVTMAEHFHRAGYQTAVFTSNPNAGSLSGLQRGVDVFRDGFIDPHSASSGPLQDEFFEWREAYPGQPYWVHFQTTDVHEPHHPVAPFKGMFVSPERANQFHEWWERHMSQPEDTTATSMVDGQLKRLAALKIDRVEFFDIMRGLYDETMAHQDYQLGRFIARLKETGEWENTILVIAADHGHPAASYSRFGRMLMDSLPPEWEGAILGSYNTHIPMIFFGPGVPQGKRIRAPVSMIDMLPTLLELAGLPEPEVKQGRSLVPLMQDRPDAELRPVIFDEFYVDPETNHLRGNIEMIDGRWGASLEIAHLGENGELSATRRFQAPASGRWAFPPHRFDSIPRLLLYDLWEDPFAFHNVSARHPDLVQKYTELLEKQWEAHRLLATRFTPGARVELTPEQLATLRALGYIR